ncbi:hypothetical protein BH24ACT7_BH24ACT7_21480 [soil metagenome]
MVKTEGDSFFAVFAAAADAVTAAADAQRALASQPWPEGASIRARMGIHTGTGTLGGDDYVGIDVHRAARIADSAHGGQTVLSEAAAVLAERAIADDLTLRDLGKHRLKDLAEPETMFELIVGGLEEEFPILRTLDAIPNNLPMLVTSFVGRERDLAEALRLLERTRVLTLTGPGGHGQDQARPPDRRRARGRVPPTVCSSSIWPRLATPRWSRRGSSTRSGCRPHPAPDR